MARCRRLCAAGSADGCMTRTVESLHSRWSGRAGKAWAGALTQCAWAIARIDRPTTSSMKSAIAVQSGEAARPRIISASAIARFQMAVRALESRVLMGHTFGVRRWRHCRNGLHSASIGRSVVLRGSLQVLNAAKRLSVGVHGAPPRTRDSAGLRPAAT